MLKQGPDFPVEIAVIWDKQVEITRADFSTIAKLLKICLII